MLKTRFSNSYILNPVVFCLIAAIAITALGCDSTSADRIAAYQAAITQARSVSAEADAYSTQLDTVIAESEAAIAAGLPAEQADSLLEKIAKAKSVKSTVIAYKQAAEIQAAKCQATIDELVASGRDDFGAELEAIGSIVTGAGATVPPPVGTWLALIGTLMGISGAAVGRVYGKKKATEAAAPSVAALAEVVKGVDDLLSQAIPERDIEKAKQLLMLRQSPETQAIVGEIKSK